MSRTRWDGELGVLALQGDFAEHLRMIDRLGVSAREVRTREELRGLQALILPGGESTTMLKFMQEESLLEPIRELYRQGGALYGTCAGAILMASEVRTPSQNALGLLDVTIERNGYGRQLESHESEAPCPKLGEPPLPMIFIRAPVIERTGPTVEVLAEHRGRPVLVRQDRLLASTFHPELTDDERVHRYFLESVVTSGHGPDDPTTEQELPSFES